MKSEMVFDNHVHLHKDHEAKPVLEMNAVYEVLIADNYDNYDDTIPAAKEAARLQRKSPAGRGYLSFAHTNDDQNVAMRRVLLRSNIVFIVNHGDPGEIQIGNVWGKRCVASNSPEPNIPAIDTFSFSKVIFIAFVGCNTASTSPIHGNLLNAAVGSGAKIAMGFTDYIAFNYNTILKK